MTAGAWEVTLRCTFGSRSDILELPITTPASETNDLVYSRGTLTLCPTRDSSQCSVVIGRISGAPISTFETYEPDTFIGPSVDGGDHIYEVEDEPAKKRKGRLPKVARSDDDSALKEPENEMVVAPSTTRRRIPSSDKLTTPIWRGPPKRALFSGYNPAGPLTKFLKRSGVDRVEEATSRMDYVCVVPSTPLKTTLKVLRSLIANKPLVTEEWLSASKKAGSLLEADSYIHKDVIDTDRRSLFNGKILFFTSAAKRSYGGGWDDISQIAKAVGATSVESGSATTGHNITPKDRVIFFGLDQEDKDAAALVRDHARIVYVKSMLTETIVKASFASEASRITLDS